MIATEWHVSSLRQRGATWDDMTDDDRAAVVALEVYRRRSGTGPLTRTDLIDATAPRRAPDPAAQQAATDEALARMAAMRGG